MATRLPNCKLSGKLKESSTVCHSAVVRSGRYAYSAQLSCAPVGVAFFGSRYTLFPWVMGGFAPPGVAWFQGQSAPCSPPPSPVHFSLGQIPGATPPLSCLKTGFAPRSPPLKETRCTGFKKTLPLQVQFGAQPLHSPKFQGFGPPCAEDADCIIRDVIMQFKKVPVLVAIF